MADRHMALGGIRATLGILLGALIYALFGGEVGAAPGLAVGALMVDVIRWWRS